MNFNIVTLGDLVEITSSKRIYASDYTTSGIPFYRSKEIIELHNNNDISVELYISTEQFDKLANKYGAPQKGDILLTSVGTLGIPYLVKTDNPFYFKDGNLTWFRNFNGIDNEFLYYYLNSDEAKKRFDEITIGSTQKALTIVSLKSIKINLPEIETQQKIVRRIKYFDEKIENNMIHISTLQNMIKAIYQHWFNEFNYANATGELVFNDKLERGVPSDLDAMKFQRFITPCSEKIGETVAPIYSTTNNGITLRDEKFNKNLTKSQSKNKKVVKDDLIFGLSREILNFGVFTEEIGSVSPAYQIFKIDQSIILPFMLELEIRINMPRYMDILQLGAREGQGIRKDYLMNKYFLVPKMSVQEEFWEIYDTFQQKIAKLKEENAVLSEIRDTLLPKLMSGELPVEVGEE